MGLFKKKSPDFIDLGERYKKDFARAESIKSGGYMDITETKKLEVVQEEPNSNACFFNMFGGSSNSFTSSSSTSNSSAESISGMELYGDSVNAEEKRRKLAKRLGEMTQKLENVSNQLYHLQQRMELVEKKLDIGRY